MNSRALLLAITLLFSCVAGEAKEFFVATDGSNQNPGTKERPFATLERARDALRQWELTKANDKSAIVRIREGEYFLSRTFFLGKADSGTPERPHVYAAYESEKPRLIGGQRLEPEWFSPVAETSRVWDRIDPAARGKVTQADLKARGIRDFGKMVSRGFAKGALSPLELSFNGKAMTLARWPNEGFAYTVGAPKKPDDQIFRYEGDRPERWRKEPDLWVQGYFFFDWADALLAAYYIDTTKKTISIEPSPRFGIGEHRPYYALNALSELDTPGEWYLDRRSGILYFWPPAPLRESVILASMMEMPVVKISEASHVILRNLTVESCRGDAIEIENGARNLVERCVIRNTGNRGVAIQSGEGHGVSRCEIYGTGTAGVFLNGGDRATLTPAGNFVTDCDIHDFSQRERTFTPGVDIDGVGNRVAHNSIHHASHFAVRYRGNDHMIEYNDIHNVCRETADAGAVYAGRDWAGRGNTVRYNFIHDLETSGVDRSGVQGVYLDDCDSGHRVFGNIFYNIPKAAVLIGGGRDNLVENNIMVRCGWGVHIDPRGTTAIVETGGLGGTSANLRGRIEKLNYRHPPWSTRFPKLAAIMNEGYEEAKKPKGNEMVRNIAHRVGIWLHDDETPLPESPLNIGASKYLTRSDNLPDSDPLFVDEAALDMRLKTDSPALKIPGFKPIPFKKIGIRPEGAK